VGFLYEGFAAPHIRTPSARSRHLGNLGSNVNSLHHGRLCLLTKRHTAGQNWHHIIGIESSDEVQEYGNSNGTIILPYTHSFADMWETKVK